MIGEKNMLTIKRCELDKAEKFRIDNALWDTTYIPEVYAQITYDNNAFLVKFTVWEKNPTREKTKNFEFVHEDSCVEFFANFTPETSDEYINFEYNANAVINFALRRDRYSVTELSEDDALCLEANSQINEDNWCVNFKIPFSFIKKCYPDFDISTCKYIKGNLYKCGDKTPQPHTLSAFIVGCENPDFHRPEYFQRINIE